MNNDILFETLLSDLNYKLRGVTTPRECAAARSALLAFVQDANAITLIDLLGHLNAMFETIDVICPYKREELIELHANWLTIVTSVSS